MPDLFDILDFIPDIRNRDELIKLAVLHGVNVQRTLQAAADLNRAVDYEAMPPPLASARTCAASPRT